MKRLPAPVRGGSLDELKTFLNTDDNDDFALVVSWLIGAFRPGYPTPILVLNGEQGSAKSTTSRLLRSLVDPKDAPLRAEPRDPRDVAVAANNSHIVALDNLSRVATWLSDSMCRLATGGGFSTRALYTDDEEAIFDALRPVMVNGIDDLATRGDLLDRALCVTLPRINDDKRKTESSLRQSFDDAQPRLLGAICDALCVALQRVGSVPMTQIPRMADFAEWIVAAEPALPWDEGRFLKAYTGNRESVHELAIESSPVGPVVRQFADQLIGGTWTGKAGELLDRLNDTAGDSARKQKGWPTKAASLGSTLRRLAPNLRALGVDVRFERSKHGRTITVNALRKVTQNAVTAVTAVTTPADGSKNGDSGDSRVTADDSDDGIDDSRVTAEIPRDDADDSDDGNLHLHSEDGGSPP